MIKRIKRARLLRWLGDSLAILIAFIAIAFTVAYIKREEIKQGILSSLNERVNGTISVKKIRFTIVHRFPTFSVALHEVRLDDTAGVTPVLTAEKIFVDIGFYSLFRNEINIKHLSIENAVLFLFKNRNGLNNYSSLWKTKYESTSPGEKNVGYSLNLRTFDFNNVAFSYIDSLKQKKISLKFRRTTQELQQSGPASQLLIKGKIDSDELTFNAGAGGFLIERSLTIGLRVDYDKDKKSILIHPSDIKTGSDQIHLAGEFHLNENLFSLRIASKQLLMRNGLSYVNARIKKKVEQFSIDKPVDVEVYVRGKLKGGTEPEVDVSFRGKDVKFVYGKIDMQHVTCTGQYLHRPDSSSVQADRSSVDISSFRATFEGIPFEGKVQFTRLFDPVMKLSMKSRVTPAMFNKLVDTTEWVSRSGSFFSSVEYRGSIEEYLDPASVRYKGKLSGTFRARNGSLEYKPKKLLLTNVNGSGRFNEKQFSIDSLNVTLNGSPVTIKGLMKNYVPFFIQPEKKGFVTLDLRSSNLDLSFVSSEKKAARKSKTEIRENQKKLNSVIAVIQRKLQFQISVNAEKFAYKKFRAQNIRGQVDLNNDILEASNIQMTVADGEMGARIFLRSDDNGRKYLAVNAQVKHANIREFFLMFNNFNQKAVGAENLEGKISARANFTADVLPDYTINAPSMKGNVSCTIRDGRLINFEPLQNISSFLFQKRDFADVQFAEVVSYFDVNGTDIDIDRMEVQSSVLSFYVEGRYSFKDSTSMSLQIPLSNLKRRDKNFKPENVGTDAKRGMSVFLHVYRYKDVDSKINISYDPFKKWVKKV